MSVSEIEFRVSKLVASLMQESQSYVPPEGSSVVISEFSAEAAYDRDIEVAIIWDFEGEDEDFLWTVKGSGSLKQRIEIPAEEVDGVKKLALILDNGTISELTMSASMTILVDIDE